jgi:drug/metabolite transporter (DMT)-like permease
MSDTLRAYLFLGFGVLCIGFSAIFVRWANAPGAVTGFYRMAVAVLVLAYPFYRRQQATRPEAPWQLPRREVAIALFGGLFFAGDLIFWNTGILLGGATNPTLMGNTAPVWVGLGALIFFKERLPLSFWLGLLLAMAGATLILGLDLLRDFSLGLGTFLGLIAGVFYGGYFLLTQRGRQQLDALTYFWIAAAGATGLLFLAALLLRQPLLGYDGFTYLNFLALGLVVQVFGQFAFSYTLGYLPASVVSPAGLGQPLVTALLAWPLLGEVITPLQAVGGLAVLAGVYVVHRSRLRPEATAEPGLDAHAPPGG